MCLVREGGEDVIEDEPDALPLGAEGLGQLGGHGDRVHVARLHPHRTAQLYEQRSQGMRVPLNLERPGLHVDDLAVRDARDFGVHAADVPAEHAGHVSDSR